MSRTTSFEICIKNKTAHSFVDLFNPLMQSLNHPRVLTCYFQITKEMTEEYNSANTVFLCWRSHVQNKRMETPLWRNFGIIDISSEATFLSSILIRLPNVGNYLQCTRARHLWPNWHRSDFCMLQLLKWKVISRDKCTKTPRALVTIRRGSSPKYWTLIAKSFQIFWSYNCSFNPYSLK